MRQTSFAADKGHSDDEVIWDDAEEDDDAGSNAAAEGSTPPTAMTGARSSKIRASPSATPVSSLVPPP
jgi:hypothetical protein